MDFGWDDAQEELYRRSLAFAHERLNDSVAERCAEGRFDADAWRRAGEFGLTGLTVAERYGGMGLDALTAARVLEAFGRGCEDTGLLFSACAHLFACAMPLLEHGSDELRDEMLPRLASGASIGANAITESEAGSDVFALKTRAVRSGDDYVLSGSKSFVSNAPVADVLLVYASTEPTHGYLGISAFAVPRDTDGLSIGEPMLKTGLTTAKTSAIYLDGCRVPARYRVDEEGGAAAIFERSMTWERTCLFAIYIGQMHRQIEQTIEYAKTRRQFGKPIAKHQGVSHRIAEMWLRLETARLMLYRACWSLEHAPRHAAQAAAMAKLAVSEAAVESGMDAIRIHGGAGVMTETGVDRGLRDALPSAIFSGTSEIQRDLIARTLGL